MKNWKHPKVLHWQMDHKFSITMKYFSVIKKIDAYNSMDELQVYSAK
jgi:hypothetical protein